MPAVLRQVPGNVLGLLLCIVLFVTLTPLTAQAETAELKPAAEAMLELQEALARTLQYNPELSAYAEEIRAREAEALQAGLWPNPVLSFEAENVFGSGDFSGTDAAETTISLSQPLALGNKPSRRRQLAEADAAVAGSDHAQATADILAGTTENFFAVMAAQERLKLADELVGLARQVLETVEERIEAGKAPATERLRANIQFRELEITRDRVFRDLTAARSTLAASMGSQTVDFGAVAGELFPLPDLPRMADLESAIAKSPLMSKGMAEAEHSRRAVALARAERTPDLELGLGARYLRESDDTALVFGVSIPLPVFNRNQGGIAAAKSRQSQAEARQRSLRLQTKATLDATWQVLAAAREEAGVLGDEIVPEARKTLEAVEYGYRAGKFGILDVLDAQRTLVEVQGRCLDAFVAFRRAEAELNRLLGLSLPASGSPASDAVSNKE